MAILTLTSDWGTKDYYASAVKGKILSLFPDATIVDITHEIEPFNSIEAAYIIKNTYKNFPDGTIHLIGMNTEESMDHPHTVVYYDNHYFIGTDDGIFSSIFERKPEKIIEMEILQDTENFTFSSRDRFVKAAIHLLEGKPIEELGSNRTELTEKLLFEPVVNKDSISGIVMHIDRYNNLITNISKELFEKVVGKKKFTISLRSSSVSKISKSYDDVPEGEIVALFASNGMLEIAMNRGKAAPLLGVERYRHSVLININE
jgi:S-adenosylmethionine hydrolase